MPFTFPFPLVLVPSKPKSLDPEAAMTISSLPFPPDMRLSNDAPGAAVARDEDDADADADADADVDAPPRRAAREGRVLAYRSCFHCESVSRGLVSRAYGLGRDIVC